MKTVNIFKLHNNNNIWFVQYHKSKYTKRFSAENMQNCNQIPVL